LVIYIILMVIDIILMILYIYYRYYIDGYILDIKLPSWLVFFMHIRTFSIHLVGVGSDWKSDRKNWGSKYYNIMVLIMVNDDMNQ